MFETDLENMGEYKTADREFNFGRLCGILKNKLLRQILWPARSLKYSWTLEIYGNLNFNLPKFKMY